MVDKATDQLFIANSARQRHVRHVRLNPLDACPKRLCMSYSDFAFSHRFRVRWSETDAQGVVFNARYLDYADIAITEYWRAAKLRAVEPELALEFHVARAEVDFRKPILPDEMIIVRARTLATGRTSLTQLVAIYGEHGDEDLRAEVRLVSVYVDLESHRPQPLPAWLAEHFRIFDERAGMPDQNA